jgi:hypothetical protein
MEHASFAPCAIDHVEHPLLCENACWNVNFASNLSQIFWMFCEIGSSNGKCCFTSFMHLIN